MRTMRYTLLCSQQSSARTIELVNVEPEQTGLGSSGRTTGYSERIVKFGVSNLSVQLPFYVFIYLSIALTECPIPPLSVLLENPRIKETDSFVICVQIHSPVGPFFPQQPFAAYVPRDLLDGLEASLDKSSECSPMRYIFIYSVSLCSVDTGDVQFVCLERKEPGQDVEVEITPESPDTETPTNRRTSSSTSSSTSQGFARKRFIYAHSDILKRRSEYFATMLSSSFSENAAGAGGSHERKMYTIVVEEADFVTIYWLLKWVYANWLLFKEHDDPKLAVEGVGAGWSAKSLSGRGRGDEWGWKPFGKGNFDSPLDVSDTRSIASSEGVPSVGGGSRAPPGKPKKTFPGSTGQTPSTMRSTGSTRPRVPSTSGSKAPTSPVRPPPSPTRRTTSAPGNTGTPSTLAVPVSEAPPPAPAPLPRASNPAPVPISPTATTFPAGSPHYPISPRQQRQRTRPSLVTTLDPHPHPTPSPIPASALSMYQIAHRYAMPGLAALALEHMMSTITPQSSFALLMATSAWDELHALVEVSSRKQIQYLRPYIC